MSRAWRLYASSWPVFSGAVIILFLSWVLLEVAVAATQRLGIVPWAILHVAFLIAFAGLVAGVHRLALDAVDGRELRLINMFALMDRGPGLLVAFLAYVDAVIAGILALLVPALYVAGRLSLLGQVAAAGSRSPVRMLMEAGSVTRGHWRGAAGTLGIVILLNVCGAALVGVGLLVAWPVSVLLATGFYRSLRPA